MYIFETAYKNKLSGGLSLGLWVLFLRVEHRNVCKPSYSIYSLQFYPFIEVSLRKGLFLLS